jgi:hypothetical protein
MILFSINKEIASPGQSAGIAMTFLSYIQDSPNQKTVIANFLL